MYLLFQIFASLRRSLFIPDVRVLMMIFLRIITVFSFLFESSTLDTVFFIWRFSMFNWIFSNFNLSNSVSPSQAFANSVIVFWENEGRGSFSNLEVVGAATGATDWGWWPWAPCTAWEWSFSCANIASHVGVASAVRNPQAVTGKWGRRGHFENGMERWFRIFLPSGLNLAQTTAISSDPRATPHWRKDGRIKENWDTESVLDVTERGLMFDVREATPHSEDRSWKMNHS